ncbi:MAG TPA: response regulator transcription factor [Streptosporangiaceae bacterium]|nr:response regulator transcription factor [Streptosporangiaceae bacterium]
MSVRLAEPRTVLLAEHEPEVAELVRRYLAREGLSVRAAAGPEETTAALAERSAAVAVLDLTMPGLDARQLRRLLAEPRGHPGERVRPILLTGGGGMRPADLRAGRDCCLPRPFSPRMLTDWVLAALTQRSPSAPPDPGPASRTAVGALTMDRARRRVMAGGRDVGLTPAEFTVLACLADHAGRVLTREQLLAAIRDRGTSPRAGAGRGPWPARGPRRSAGAADGAASTRAIDVYIAQLRAKLPGRSPIRTVRGVGYVLDGPG